MKKKIIAFIMAALTFSTLAMGGCAEIGEKIGGEIDKLIEDVTNDAGNVDEGIALVKTTLSQEDYATYGVSSLAESSHLLTATVEPAGAQVSLVWSVAWDESDLTWATNEDGSVKDISDYLVIEPTSEGATTATLTCFGAFGNRAIVTVAVKDGDASTTCTVDYAHKVENTYLQFLATDNSKYLDYNCGFTVKNGANVSLDVPLRSQAINSSYVGWNVTYGMTFGDGSVWTLTEPTSGSVLVSVSEEFQNALLAQQMRPTLATGNYKKLIEHKIPFNVMLPVGIDFAEFFSSLCTGVMTSTSDKSFGTGYNKFLLAAQNVTGHHAVLKVSYPGVNADGSAWTETYKVTFTTSSIAAAVAESVSLDSSEVVL